VYAQNGKDTNTYVEIINKGRFTIEKGYRLNQTEKIIRHVITEIMCNEYVSFDETAQAFDLSKEDVKKALNFDEALFGGFISDGLLRVEKGEIFNVTETGRFFIRNIATQFDPNLRTATQHFSKAL